MAAIQDNQAVAWPAPKQGSEDSCETWNLSATSNDDGTTYQQEPEAGQKTEEARPATRSQPSTAAHADDAIGAPALFSSTTEVDRQRLKRGRSACHRQEGSKKVRTRSPLYQDLSCADLTPQSDGGSPEDNVALHVMSHYRRWNWQRRHVRDVAGGNIFHLRLKHQWPPQRVPYQSPLEGSDIVWFVTDVYTIGGEVLCIFVDALKVFPECTRGSPGQRDFIMKCCITKICFAYPGETATDIQNLLQLSLGGRQVMPRFEKDILQQIPQTVQQAQAMHSHSNGSLQESGPLATASSIITPEGTMPNHAYAASAANMGVIEQSGTRFGQPDLYAEGTGFANNPPPQAYGQVSLMALPHQQSDVNAEVASSAFDHLFHESPGYPNAFDDLINPHSLDINMGIDATGNDDLAGGPWQQVPYKYAS